MKNSINKLLQRREFRFLIVGGINTLVGYGTYALFLLFGTPYLIANTIATVVGVINSYIWNRFFTFNSKDKAWSEIIRFSLVYLVSYCVSMVFLYVVVDSLKFNAYIAGVLNLIVTTLISWFGHKNFSFRVSDDKRIDSTR